jgi:hypothetical protein
MSTGLSYSAHALRRMAQRGISNEEIEYVCRYGRLYNCGGTFHYFLRKKDIPVEDWSDPEIQKLEGTIVLVDRITGAFVLTVYRNKQGLRQIRRKAKYELTQ